MLVTMTDKELYRLGIIQRVFDRALLQRDAADILELSVRQVQRLGSNAFSESQNRRCIRRPVASSMKTRRQHFGALPSNQSW